MISVTGNSYPVCALRRLISWVILNRECDFMSKRTIRQWQRVRIAEGLRQADAGEFAPEREVAAALARWRTKPRRRVGASARADRRAD
jgi:predicted transcriptional regulator